MTYLTVETIPTRNWKQNLDIRDISILHRDKSRTKNQYVANRRIHYLWFHYLKLCMNLEQIGYRVQKKKKGNHQPSIIEKEIKVIVNKDIYKDWSLNTLHKMKFHNWYKDQKHFILFYEGGFEVKGRQQYKHLVRKFNVFIEYQNRMESFEYTRGDMTKIMKVSEDILELYQKERYDKEKFGSRQYDSVVRSDVKNCENIILTVCEGRFPN